MTQPEKDKDRKLPLEEDKYNATNFLTLWDFEGVFKYSPLFYGWYTSLDPTKISYRLPFAYFITGLMVYAYSFFATLRKMAENSRMSKLSEKDDECIFSWKLFTAWDYMIGNAETAHNRVASIVVGFKEALLEEAEKKRPSRNWKIIAFRIMVNTIVLGLLSFSAFAVVMVVKRSTEPESGSTVWRRNEITVVLSLISLFFPMGFEILGLLEQYHPRKQLRIQLARIMVLNLLNLYSLIFALFDKISDMTFELETFKNSTETHINSSIISTYAMNNSCYNSCIKTSNNGIFNIITSGITNFTAVADSQILEIATSSGVTSDISGSSYNYDMEADMITTTVSTVIKRTVDDLQDTASDYLANLLKPFTENENDSSSTTIIDSIFTSTVAPLSEISDERISYDFSSAFPESSTITIVPEKNYINLNCGRICAWNYTTRSRLRNLCWETMFGQELIKLTVMDLVMTLMSTLAIDFVRGIFVRTMNRCWCWDLEKKFPQYADFKVAENILHLVNNQGMVWMGMFFSPGLVLINVVKLYAMMYLRAWTVLTCNVPHEIIFRASRSNNFYYALLLMMLFLCVLPVGYAIVWIKPSWNCGPFSTYQRIFHIFTKTIKHNVPELIAKALDYIASPGIVIPLLVLLILVIYYLISLTGALREANNDLKTQLRRERTVERRKMFQIADKRRRRGSGGSADTPFAKWNKLIKNMPENKSFDETPRQESVEVVPVPAKIEKPEIKKIDFFTKFVRKALRKSSTSDEENPNVDDGTDTEQHESLPEDLEVRPQVHAARSSSGSFDFQRIAGSLLQKVRNQSPKTSPTEVVVQQDNKPSPVEPIRRASTETRQDSASSWSDIPIIKISKTESAECLDDESRTEAEDEDYEEIESKFVPKVRYALKKQNSELDENVICYFPQSLPQKFGIDEIEDFGKSESSGDITRASSVDTVLKLCTDYVKQLEEETKINQEESKDQVIIKIEEPEQIKEKVDEKDSPNGSNSTQTEPSSDYNDDTI